MSFQFKQPGFSYQPARSRVAVQFTDSQLITRWQGITSGIGFLAITPPTARLEPGLPARLYFLTLHRSAPLQKESHCRPAGLFFEKG